MQDPADIATAAEAPPGGFPFGASQAPRDKTETFP